MKLSQHPPLRVRQESQTAVGVLGVSTHTHFRNPASASLEGLSQAPPCPLESQLKRAALRLKGGPSARPHNPQVSLLQQVPGPRQSALSIEMERLF